MVVDPDAMSEIEFRCGLSEDRAEYPREDDDEIDAVPLPLFAVKVAIEDPSTLFLEEGERYIRALLAIMSTRLPIECLRELLLI